jgi:hypothetical protein
MRSIANSSIIFAFVFNPIFKQRMTWAGGWFSSWIESGHIPSFSANGNQFVGRANGLLADWDEMTAMETDNTCSQ